MSTAVWDGGPTGLGTDWHDPLNWKGDVLPFDGEDVTLPAGPTVEYSIGTLSLHSISSDRPLAIKGGVLGVSTIAVIGNLVTLDGGALSGGSWTLAGPGLTATSNPGNILQGVSINGDIALTAEDAFIRIADGLTVNGLVLISGEDAAISFNGGTQMLSGNADILFSGWTGQRYLSVDGDGILTIGSAVQITGTLGSLVSGRFSGSGAIINQGTIWADVDSGLLEILPSVFTNLGTVRATDFATLRIGAGLWTTSGVVSTSGGNIRFAGTLDITAGLGVFSRIGGDVLIEGTILNTGSTLTLNAATGVWRFRGGQIIGGTINVTPNGWLADAPFQSGRLANLTINGDFAWQSSSFAGELDAVTINGAFTFGNFSSLTIRNTLTLNGTFTVTGANTLVEFVGGPQQLLGSMTVLLRNEEAYFWALQPLTIPAAASISGYGRLFGTIVNEGSVSADSAGKVLIIGHGVFYNESQVVATAGELWIGEPGGAPADFINNDTFAASGSAAVLIGPRLNAGPVLFHNKGSMTFSDSATLQVGRAMAFRPVELRNSGTFTLSDSSLATIGSLQAVVPIVLDNSGVITVESNATFSFETLATTAQIGDLRAAGGTVIIRGDITNTGAILGINATTGTWLFDGGGVLGGTILFADGAQLLFNSNELNLFHNVTIQGDFELSEDDATLAVTGGLTLQGSFTLSGEGSSVRFDGGAQTIAGSGSIILSGDDDTQSVLAVNGAIVTIGAGITVIGESGDGRLSSGPGGGNFVNAGTVAGDVLIDADSFTNLGTVEAREGHTLEFTGTVTNVVASHLSGGTWRVLAGSTLILGNQGLTMNSANVFLSGAGATWTAMSALRTNSGSLTVTNQAQLSLSGSLLNAGALTLGPAAVLSAPAATLSKKGTLNIQVSALGTPQLQIAGSIGVYGALNVTWNEGFTPSPGSFTFLTAASVKGQFGVAMMQVPGTGLGRLLTYSPTTVSVVVFRFARP